MSEFYEKAKELFDDMIGEDTLHEMKYQKMIACVDGFRLSCIAQIELELEQVKIDVTEELEQP